MGLVEDQPQSRGLWAGCLVGAGLCGWWLAAHLGGIWPGGCWVAALAVQFALNSSLFSTHCVFCSEATVCRDSVWCTFSSLLPLSSPPSSLLLNLIVY